MDKTERGALLAFPETRSYPAQFEVRTLSGPNVEVSGYASTFEQPYDMYDMFGRYAETVRHGAFDKTLSEGADVAFLTNHAGLTMARTRADTLALSADTSGLLSVATLNTARSDVRDLVLAIEDRNVDQMSFGFRVVQQQWSPDYDERALVELNLDRGDVSAVNYGANPSTSIGVQRAFRNLRAAKLARRAAEIREGKTLSTANADILAKILELIATADDAVDQAQPLLASVLGVPNPDAGDDDKAGVDDANDDDARALAHLETLRRRHQAEGERRRTA